MKVYQKILLALLVIILFAPSRLISQEHSLCKLIGKDVNEVIKEFGKPLHQDKSNPDMQCVYYQSKTSRMAFIADKAGVYQIQVDYYYDSKNNADKAMSDFLSECGTKDMRVDTLNQKDYKIFGSGVRMDLTLFENTFSKKYEVKVKADRSESK